MKTKGVIFMFVTLPAFAMAGGNHADGHGVSGGQAMTHHHEHTAHTRGDTDHDRHENDAGRPGNPDRVTRTVTVSMDDRMRFTPDKLDFKAGETVRFQLRNDGRIRHEMVIGSLGELKEHAAMMRTNPAMQHAEPNMISLAPGERGELVWQFDQAGTFEFACLVPGHLEAGMTGKVRVQ